MEDYFTLPTELLSKDYLINQINIFRDIIDKYPELALLNMGRIAELYLLQLLQLPNKPKDLNLAWEAHTNGFLTQQQVKLFESIRKENNALKHCLDYKLPKDKIVQFWKTFSTTINH